MWLINLFELNMNVDMLTKFGATTLLYLATGMEAANRHPQRTKVG